MAWAYVPGVVPGPVKGKNGFPFLGRGVGVEREEAGVWGLGGERERTRTTVFKSGYT